ncbi:MAG TPA: hypothetical protein VLB29_01145 [Nocardioidaceae bacterium]|nr:hypothetical protein [Nocardioidaceae bacterium]
MRRAWVDYIADGQPMASPVSWRMVACGGSFSTRGVEVLWPKKVVKQLQLSGLLAEPAIEQAHRSLAAAFASP